MIRRLVATTLLATSIGAATLALSGTANAQSICLGGDNQRRPGATVLCVDVPPENGQGNGTDSPLPH